MTNKHIRPQKRQVAAKKAPSETGRSSVQQQQPHESQPPPPTTLPKSILKLSKYGGVRRIDQDEEVVATSDSIIRDDIVQEKLRNMAAVTAANDMLSPSLAIDGYTPKLSVAAAAAAAATSTTTTTKSRESKSASTSDEDHDDKDVNDDDDDEPPLVFGSLSQLMETAGTLPSQDDNPESAAMIEADLAFRCMDRETFKDYQQMKEAEYYEACLGRPIGLVYKINDDGNNNDAYSETDENTDPSLEEDALWFGDDECDDEEDDPAESRPPRLFAILHAAVSQWVTPQAVDYVRELRDDDDNQQRQHKDRPCAYDKTDLGVSRCTGLQALLKMHCQRCWQELLVSKQSEAGVASNQRLAEQRLGELLRCFDYGQPSPKLSTAQTKALTCVLLDIAMQKELDDGIGGNNAVPTCCELQGMAMDEYMYLTRSAFASFGAPAEDDE